MHVEEGWVIGVGGVGANLLWSFSVEVELEVEEDEAMVEISGTFSMCTALTTNFRMHYSLSGWHIYFALLRMHFHFCTPARTHTHTGDMGARTRTQRHRNRRTLGYRKKVNKTFSLPPCAQAVESLGGFRCASAGRCIKCNKNQ